MKNLVRFTIVVVLATTVTSCCLTKDAIENDTACRILWSTNAGAIASNISEGGDYGGDENESKLGFQLGANVLFPINQNLRLETGLGYASKGSKSSYSSQDGEESFSQEDKLNLSYLEAPILLRYQFNNTGFNAYGGLQPGLLLSAKQKSEASGSASQDIDVKDRFKGFDTSAVFGIGYEFNNGFMLNAGYDLGLMNIAESSEFGNATAKNRSFKISLGYIFGK